MALLPEFRGHGLGGRLMRRALDAAQNYGLHRIELTVRENNKNAIALYRKLGFETEGLLRYAIKVDDAYENVVLMALCFSRERATATCHTLPPAHSG